MEVQLNNLIDNTTTITHINSKDTVIGLKKVIASSSFYSREKINASNIQLSYIDPNTNQINYMLSPYRPILSYNGISNTKQIYVEKIGIQIDSAIAIIIENFLPIITFYYLYNNDFYYTKLFIHKILFILTFLYFICRLFICLKSYNSGKYFLNKLIINLIIYWFLYSIFCGYSIFNDELDDMNIYSYLFTIVFIFCQFLCVKLVKEYIDNKKSNILFNYVKYPYYSIDCLLWISIMIIIHNKRIIFFTFVKIIYNIYLAFEKYIEEQGVVKIASFQDNENNNNRINTKIIIPFIL